jgi:hypothetical protein
MFVRPMLLLSLATVLASTWAFSVVRAGTIETWNMAGWSAGAYTDDRTGAFSHCAMSASYRSGITMFFCKPYLRLASFLQ